MEALPDLLQLRAALSRGCIDPYPLKWKVNDERWVDRTPDGDVECMPTPYTECDILYPVVFARRRRSIEKIRTKEGKEYQLALEGARLAREPSLKCEEFWLNPVFESARWAALSSWWCERNLIPPVFPFFVGSFRDKWAPGRPQHLTMVRQHPQPMEDPPFESILLAFVALQILHARFGFRYGPLDGIVYVPWEHRCTFRFPDGTWFTHLFKACPILLFPSDMYIPSEVEGSMAWLEDAIPLAGGLFGRAKDTAIPVVHKLIPHTFPATGDIFKSFWEPLLNIMQIEMHKGSPPAVQQVAGLMDMEEGTPYNYVIPLSASPRPDPMVFGRPLMFTKDGKVQTVDASDVTLRPNELSDRQEAARKYYNMFMDLFNPETPSPSLRAMHPSSFAAWMAYPAKSRAVPANPLPGKKFKTLEKLEEMLFAVDMGVFRATREARSRLYRYAPVSETVAILVALDDAWAQRNDLVKQRMPMHPEKCMTKFTESMIPELKKEKEMNEEIFEVLNTTASGLLPYRSSHPDVATLLSPYGSVRAQLETRLGDLTERIRLEEKRFGGGKKC